MAEDSFWDDDTSGHDVSDFSFHDDSSSTTSGDHPPVDMFGRRQFDDWGDSPSSDFDGSCFPPPVDAGDDDDGVQWPAAAGLLMEPLVAKPRPEEPKREPAKAQPQTGPPSRSQRNRKKRRQTKEEAELPAGFDTSVLPTLPPQGALLPAGPVRELSNELVYALLRDPTQVAHGPRPAVLEAAHIGAVFMERQAGLFRNLKPITDRQKGAERWKQSDVSFVRQLKNVSFGGDGRGQVWVKKMYGSVFPAGRFKYHA